MYELLNLVDYLHVEGDKPWYNYYIYLFQMQGPVHVLSVEVIFFEDIIYAAGITLNSAYKKYTGESFQGYS